MRLDATACADEEDVGVGGPFRPRRCECGRMVKWGEPCPTCGPKSAAGSSKAPRSQRVIQGSLVSEGDAGWRYWPYC